MWVPPSAALCVVLQAGLVYLLLELGCAQEEALGLVSKHAPANPFSLYLPAITWLEDCWPRS